MPRADSSVTFDPPSLGEGGFTHPNVLPAPADVGRGGLLSLIRAGLALFAERCEINPSARLVLTLPFAEQRLYLASLVAANRKLFAALAAEAGAPSSPVATNVADDNSLYDVGGPLAFVQRYNQLPCTLRTRRARADLFEAVGLRDARILLLGDDDLVSVELSRRGFSDVTVADCDPALLAEIERRTTHAKKPPKLERADFRRGFLTPRPADVVCLDPPHHEAAIRLFLDVAIANVDRSAVHHLFVMYNSHLIGRAGAARVERYVEGHGYLLGHRHDAFNAYPMTGAQKIAFRSFARFVLGKAGALPKRAELNYFSDCFIYKRDLST